MVKLILLLVLYTFTMYKPLVSYTKEDNITSSSDNTALTSTIHLQNKQSTI